MPQTHALTRSEVQESFEQLRREVVSGGDEEIGSYLTELAHLAANAHRVSGSFRRWSHRNHLMLESQRRRFAETHRGLYAGRAQWRKLDRSVLPDARPKLIWAALGSKNETDAAVQTPKVPQGVRSTTTSAVRSASTAPAKVTPATSAKASSVACKRSSFKGFRLVEVFDWTDTVSNDPDAIEPDWEAPLVGGFRATLDSLAEAAPFSVVFAPLGGVEGHLRMTDREVAIEESLPVGNRIAALCRAWALHDLGSDKSVPVPDREAEAVVASVLACQMLGLDTDGAATRTAATYLRCFAEPDGTPIAGIKRQLKMLNGRLDRAMTIANSVVAKACNA